MTSGEEDAIPDLLRCFHLRIDRVGDTDEDALTWLQDLTDRLEHPFRIAFTGELEVEGPRVELEEERQQVRVGEVGAVRRVGICGTLTGADTASQIRFTRLRPDGDDLVNPCVVPRSWASGFATMFAARA